MNVSAICTTLNCSDGLAECLQLLLRHVRSGDLAEIVVVDGGSTDGTWDTLVQLAHQDDRLRVFQESGANISRGRNLAIQRAAGDIILSIDSGCQLAQDFVPAILRPFEDPSCDVTGGKTIPLGKSSFEETVAFLAKGTKKDQTNPSSRAIAFRRHVFDAIGGYDESVQAGEDSHFNLKWRSRGFKFMHAADAIIRWRVRPSLRSLYRMTRRNSRGSVNLAVPWKASGWASRIAALSALSVAFILPWLIARPTFMWGVALCIPTAFLVVYFSFRMMRRNRWRHFLWPRNLGNGILIMLACDMGILSGTTLGWVDRWQRLKAEQRRDMTRDDSVASGEPG
jgi:glycosyltransferase involved in cell wall biosynthesis